MFHNYLDKLDSLGLRVRNYSINLRFITLSKMKTI